LADILSKVNENSEFDLKNSYECAEKLKSIKLPPDYILISLDVTALFDSISPQLARKVILEEWDTIKKYTDIPKGLFMDMFDLCLENSYFLCKGKFYKVKIGVPMGASSSVPISSIVMNVLLRYVLNKLPFEVPFCYRFVDDLLLAIPADQVETTVDTFNSYNGFIKFTVELEKNGVLPFLDMEIHRNENGSLTTTWYSKPSATNRIINYNSNHSFQIKLNCAKGLISRIFRLTTKPNMDRWIDNKCMEILKTNNYPHSLIRRLINKYRNPPEEVEPLIDAAKIKYRSLVYVKGASEKIAKILKNVIPSCK
jgi:hypothetical protein